ADFGMQAIGRDEADERLQVGSDRNVALEIVEAPNRAARRAFPVEEVELRWCATCLTAPDQRSVPAELVPDGRRRRATDGVDAHVERTGARLHCRHDFGRAEREQDLAALGRGGYCGHQCALRGGELDEVVADSARRARQENATRRD